MSKFKYSLTLKSGSGNRKILNKFSEELKKLGYKSNSGNDKNQCGILVINDTLNSKVCNGYYDFFMDAQKRDFIFDIDNEWEYKSALAIAAVKNDVVFGIGELVKFEGGKYYLAQQGSIAKVIKSEPNEVEWLLQKDKKGNVQPITQQNGSYSSFRFTRLTPEEIKEFYQLGNTNKMEEKTIIGYKAPQNLFENQVKEGTKYVTSKAHCVYWPESSPNNYTLFLPKEIVETWEPVYEEVYEVGDWIITKGYCPDYDGKALKITKIDRMPEGIFCYFSPSTNNSHNFGYNHIQRKATEEEIKKASFIEIIVGNNDTIVTIKTDGIFARGKQLEISVLRDIVQTYRPKLDHVGGWTVVPDLDVRFIRIGCTGENNLFSLNDISRVLNEYDNLNGY